MTKREFFGLNFYRIKTTLGRYKNICKREVVGEFSSLQIIAQLERIEIEALLSEIEQAIVGGYYEDYFNSDGTSADEIRIIPPNIIINQVCTVSLVDMKALLNEWLNFIDS